MLGPQNGLFFSRWLRRPLQTGAVVPSGRSLARLMAAQVDADGTGLVVELGGGTGAITHGLLSAGVAPERLLVVERDEVLHRLLTRRFPAVKVICADAGRLGAALSRHGVAEADSVVSSLPLLAMPERRRRAILKQIFNCLGPDGELVQYSYRPLVRVVASELPPWRLECRAVGHCWRNVPPATVWRIRRVAAVNGHSHH